MTAWPSGTPTVLQIASANVRFELPENILISSFTDPAEWFPRTGREGVEPSLPDPKSGALPAWRPPKARESIQLRDETRDARGCVSRCQPEYLHGCRVSVRVAEAPA